MAGRFIISLDCEGKWGMADCLTAHHHQFLTRENLIAAYEKILRLFARHEIPATFAFVMNFTLSEDERREIGDRLCDVQVEGRNWLRNFRKAEASGEMDGWFCPEALDMVRARPEHEIGCHGFCHAPLAEAAIARDAAVQEIASAWEVARMKGLSLRTFIYPRNQIGYLDALGASGYAGYRARPPQLPGKIGRIANLAAELNVLTKSQSAEPDRAGMITIPSGYFLNWRRGARAAIPASVTRLRWRRILADAARHERTAHVFLHPHNIIDAPSTADLLDDLLGEAARLRAAGALDIVTQAEYCTMEAAAAA